MVDPKETTLLIVKVVEAIRVLFIIYWRDPSWTSHETDFAFRSRHLQPIAVCFFQSPTFPRLLI